MLFSVAFTQSPDALCASNSVSTADSETSLLHSYQFFVSCRKEDSLVICCNDTTMLIIDLGDRTGGIHVYVDLTKTE